MRETRNAQATLFGHYAKHEFGRQLEKLSELLDDYPRSLTWWPEILIKPTWPVPGRAD